MNRAAEEVANGIIHVSYDFAGNTEEIISDDYRYDYTWNDRVVLSQCALSATPKKVYKYVVDGEPVIRKKMTANGEVSYIENEKMVERESAFSLEVSFEIGDSELLLGMGQYEDGLMDYRNRTEYLYESNMRIAIPFLVTTGHYAILIDSESNMIFTEQDSIITFSIDTTHSFSYYIFTGDTIQDMLRLYYDLTGYPSMLPRWAFGYIQSKERYMDAEELIDTVKSFRRADIPIDCIVQDWYSWEEGLWGEKKFDKMRYPDMKSTVRNLNAHNVKLMVSIWPNMSPDSDNYKEFKKAGRLLDNSNLYDAFDEEARLMYFRQCRSEIMECGSSALWCDNAEPFSDADWNGQQRRPEEERYRLVTEISKKSLDWEKINSYGLYHAKGIYENWRKSYPDKRVVNLTRSGYTGCQKYGTILWSGDITATWDTLRKQICEGIKMGLTGMPYWTLDIGGFFVVNDKYENRGCGDMAHLPLWFWKGDYNDGVHDMGYRELYVRWLQMGTFLPIFRSHGTDTPREPWNFGKEGDVFYDTIVSFIRLRYRLMPYIYSIAAAAHYDGEVIMRSLLLDFPDDDKVRDINDEYMFGPAFLVAPVYTPMYYGPNSAPIIKVPKKRRVYLPDGCGWYDYYTGDYYEGGTTLDADAPIEKIPLFVKAGSIIPICEGQNYADENGGTVDDILIYKGCDGDFTLYNDDGDGYSFETGNCTFTDYHYCEETGELTARPSQTVPCTDYSMHPFLP